MHGKDAAQQSILSVLTQCSFATLDVVSVIKQSGCATRTT